MDRRVLFCLTPSTKRLESFSRRLGISYPFPINATDCVYQIVTSDFKVDLAQTSSSCAGQSGGYLLISECIIKNNENSSRGGGRISKQRFSGKVVINKKSIKCYLRLLPAF